MNSFKIREKLSDMNYNLSSVRLAKNSVVQNSAVREVEKKVISYTIGENVRIGYYLSISTVI